MNTISDSGKMTRAGYTHVLIPTSLHSVVKEKAFLHKISVERYIQYLMEYGISAGLLTLCSARILGVQVPLSSSCINSGFSNNGVIGNSKEVPVVQYTKTFEMFLMVQKNLSAGTYQTQFSAHKINIYKSDIYISYVKRTKKQQTRTL